MTATLKAPVELSNRRRDHDTKELLEFIARILGVSGLLSPPPEPQPQPQQSRIRDIIQELLTDESYRWRTLSRVAAAQAMPQERVADILREDPTVRFGRTSDGEIIVGLRSRVGERPRPKRS